MRKRLEKLAFAVTVILFHITGKNIRLASKLQDFWRKLGFVFTSDDIEFARIKDLFRR